jgi:hypothetical protein
MSGGQMMVVLIVAMVMLASIIKSKHGSHRGRTGRDGHDIAGIDAAETHRLREEVGRLKERVAVLERIATDKNHMLEDEIEQLRRIR